MGRTKSALWVAVMGLIGLAWMGVALVSVRPEAPTSARDTASPSALAGRSPVDARRRHERVDSPGSAPESAAMHAGRGDGPADTTPAPHADPAAAEAARSLRAAHIATVQAEGAADPAYAFRADGRGAASRHPTQRLEARVDERGVSLTAAHVRGRLEATSLRCDGASVPLSRGVVTHAANRAEVAKSAGVGSVREWYVHGPLGLEQGFDVSSPCARDLAVEVRVHGLTATLDGDAVRLADASGHALRYSDVFAVDADGTSLDARFGLRDGVVELHVDVANARFPIVIDPLVALETQRLAPWTSGDGAASDRFGSYVALSGDTAVVGAAGDTWNGGNGSAYVFVRSGSTWTQQAKLGLPTTAGAASPDDAAIDGDTVVLGSSGTTVGGNASQGAVYVFVRSGTTWSLQATLSASDGSSGDRLGGSVSLSGDTLVAGAATDSVTMPNMGTNHGSAYVFVRNGTTWSQQTRLTASVPVGGAAFGTDVSARGNTALVGSNADAYVFERTGTTWAQQARLGAIGGVLGSTVSSVALGTDTAVVGMSTWTVGANLGQGGVHVFVRNGTTWTLQATLTASDGITNDNLGNRVAVDGDVVVATACSCGPQQRGHAYAFVRSGTTWSASQKLYASDPLDGSSHPSVAISGATVLLGAPMIDVGLAADQGVAHVFVRSGGMWPTQAVLDSGQGATDASFGTSIALDGDTAVVGAPGTTAGVVRQGAVHVYLRTAGVWAFQARLLASDPVADAGFGSAVSLSGSTAVVGASGVDGGTEDEGAAYVFVRSGTTWTQQAKLSGTSAAAFARFGTAVAVDADTLVVGAPGATRTAGSQGVAYVFTRSGSTWSERAQVVAADATSGDAFGSSVDLEGGTFVVGARVGNGVVGNSGSAYVFVGSGSSWTQQAELYANDGAAGDGFAGPVALHADTVLVGAPSDDASVGDLGAAYAFVRNGTTWTQQAKLAPASGTVATFFGSSVALVGDVAVIGAAGDDRTRNDAGSARLFTRSGTTWTEDDQILDPTGAAFDALGGAVATDGVTALVGAPAAFGAGVYGNVGEGRVIAYRFAEGCPAGTSSPDGSIETTCAACAAGTFSTGGASACTAFTVCTASQYETAAPTATSNRVCAPLTVCTATQYESTAPTTTSDRTCSALTVCGPGEYVSSVQSATTDRICAPCALGTYSTTQNATSCAAWSPACASGYAEASPPTATSDRVCADVDECLTNNGGCLVTCTNKPGSFVCDCVDPLGECRALGATCGDGTPCASGLCVDGVCCDSACGGGVDDCQSCLGSLTGGASGTCAPTLAATVCRAGTDACDAAEVCDGISVACPADALAPPSTVCRVAAGPCDVAEACDGESPACPTDGIADAATICRAATSACDVAESCSGASVDCPADAFQPAAVACGGAATPCIAPGFCAGDSAACAAAILPNGTSCDDGSACSIGDRCVAGACVGDPAAAGQTCRPAGGVCDVAEACDGVTAACPPDRFEVGTICRASTGVCDAPEQCTGLAATCPADVWADADTVCRPAIGPCDVAEQCSGSGPSCPTDAFAPASVICGEPPNDCYEPGRCSGTSATCAAIQLPTGTPCNDGSPCSTGETCAAGACVGGAVAGAGQVCRAARGPCDVAELCDGTTTQCPADELLGDDTECRPSTGICDVAEYCNGFTSRCPGRDTVIFAGVPCRGLQGPCDVGESCDGQSASCPPDAFHGSAIVCARGSGDPCDPDDTCSGAAATCPELRSADGTPCDDALACSQASACANGSCEASLMITCSDGNPCTTDACREPTGCSFTPIAACLADAGAPDGGEGDAGPPTPPPTATGCACRVQAAPTGADGIPWFVVALVVAARRRRSRAVGAGAPLEERQRDDTEREEERVRGPEKGTRG